MPPDLSADAIRSRTFPAALRGYDKDAVDAFRDEVAGRLGELESRLARLDTSLEQLGIEEPPALDQEIKRVASDLAAILDEARRTATEMRERAAEDAARWRSTAEADAAAIRAEAQADAEVLRGSAWELATEMLETSSGEVTQRLDAARQDALFIRAEAERAELRTGAEARRAAEDLLRAARAEAEQISLDARAESERVLDAARRSAEVAQERARALEARRSELLRELEATRRSIDELESQMDEAEPGAESGAASSDQPARFEPDPSVRIVPAREVIVPGIVDADEMAAEVERMRTTPTTQDVTPEPAPAPAVDESAELEREPEVTEPAVAEDVTALAEAPLEGIAVTPAPAPPSPVDEAPAPTPGDSQPAQPEPQAVTPEPVQPEPEEPELAEAVPGPAEAVPLEPEPVSAEPAAGEEPSPVETPGQAGAVSENGTRPSAPEELVSARPAGISDLFASLRGGSDAEPSPASELERPEIAGGSGPPVEEGIAATTSVPPAQQSRPDTTVRTALDLRDRLLLPVQNQALRALKRSIVDLQNVVLESMRLAEGLWAPERSAFDQAIRPSVADLAAQGYTLGVQAAGELSGIAHAKPPVGGAPADGASHVVDAMVAAVEDSLAHAVARSAGQREITAAVSRVFRAWRTDEAERQLRTAAYHAYHEGVLAGLSSSDVRAVAAVTVGRRCAECPAARTEAWDPSGPLPDGMILPPAHPECVTTVVPAVTAPIGAAGGEQRVLQ